MSGQGRPTVQTASGPVTGRVVDGVERFLGIPYAAAPFGARRFQKPGPHARWDAFDAEGFGATAPQREGASPGGLPDVVEPIIAGEDILNLNIWAPQDRPGPLPVLVWIHGGGFFAGCSANPWYDGTAFARGGLVVVSCNYRFGAEGFLELADGPSNLALLDWIAALEWVRENIAAFGGDPSQVTVLGQSAGGIAVSALLSSSAADGLFRRAIIASGVSQQNLVPREAAEEVAASVLSEVGAERTVAAARSVPPEAFVAAHEAWMARQAASGELGLSWAPVIDGELLNGDLFEVTARGHGAGVPVMVGTTANEFAWMAYRGHPEDEAAKRAGQRQYADQLFRLPTHRFAELRVAAGSAPTYRYEFQWQSTAEPEIRAGHSLDIPFFFHNLDAPYVAEYAGPNPPVTLADEVHAAFTAFARTGDPGWPAYSPGGAVRLFGAPSRTGIAADLDLGPDADRL